VLFKHCDLNQPTLVGGLFADTCWHLCRCHCWRDNITCWQYRPFPLQSWQTAHSYFNRAVCNLLPANVHLCQYAEKIKKHLESFFF